MKLNLGCGKDIKDGWVNIDWKPYPGVDIVLDLNHGVLPYPDDSCEYIKAHDVLEHLPRWETIATECFRVLRPGGMLDVHVPHAPNHNTFHVRQFDRSSFDGFLVGSPEFRGPNATTLEGWGVAEMVKCEITRRPFYPYAWHLRKYLRLPFIGRRWMIRFVLRKVENGGR